MTVKEIAQAVNKDPATVSRWVQSVSCKMQEVSCKMQEAKQTKKPADYTLEETCAIIAEGMGQDVASVFRENAMKAQAKPQVITDQRMAELRRAFDRKLISADEYRMGIGLQYPKADMLDPKIAKQIYAVACQAIEKKKKQILLEYQSPKLFGEE